MMAKDKIRFAAIKIGISLETWAEIRIPQFPSQPCDVSDQQGQRRKNDSGFASSRQSEHHSGSIFASDGGVETGGAERHRSRNHKQSGLVRGANDRTA
jgi:hypothetical protein